MCGWLKAVCGGRNIGRKFDRLGVASRLKLALIAGRLDARLRDISAALQLQKLLQKRPHLK